MEKLTAEDEEGFRKSLNEQAKPKAMLANGAKDGINYLKCPNCKQNIELANEDLKFHKHGRRAKCPLCHKGIVMRKFVRRS